MAWAGRHRLARNADNRTPESSEAFLYLGSIAMLLNRLYPRCSFLITLEEEDFFFRAKRKAKNRCQPMQPRPAGLVSTALPCSAPSRPCMSRSDLGRCGSEFWDCFAPPHERVQCTKRRAAGGEMWYKASFRCRVQPCSTRPNLCENCYNAQSPSARRLVRDSGFIAVLIEVEPPRITAVTIELPAQRPPCMSVGKRRHPPSSPSSGVTRGSTG